MSRPARRCFQAETRVRTRFKESAPGSFRKVLNRKILDRVIKVTDDEAYQTAKQLSKMEGLLVGISAGANVFAAQQEVAEELGPGQERRERVLCDTARRYISIEKYFNI